MEKVQIFRMRSKNLSIGNVKDITGGFAGNEEPGQSKEGLSGPPRVEITTLLEKLLMCFRLWVWEI